MPKRETVVIATFFVVACITVVTLFYLANYVWPSWASVPPSMQGSISFDNATVNSATQITAYMRNSGTKIESFGTVYVDNVLITNVSFTPATIAPNEISIVIINGIGTTWNDGSVHAVTITANDGSPCTINAQS